MKKALTVLDRLFSLLHRYILELIALMFLMLFGFWSVGYFANSLYGYHFDLQSCWTGFTAISGAGFLATVKYCTDSWKNSPPGKMPGEKIRHSTEEFPEDKNGNDILVIDRKSI